MAHSNVQMPGGNERAVANEEGDMQRRFMTSRHRATEPARRQLWDAPARNHDWIAARIGRG